MSIASNNNPLVTVGILSYNRPEGLAVAIESVLAQTYENLEIIISDNGSHVPETRAVIESYAARDARIRPVLHDVNRGPQFNFSFLVEEARGEFFSWLADDDAYSPTQIEDSVRVLQTQPDVVLAANMPVIIGLDEPLQYRYAPHTVGLPLVEKYLLLARHVEHDVNVFYYGLMRTEILRRCHLYLQKLMGSDTLLLLELVRYGDLAVNRDRPGVRYAMHAGQTSGALKRYKEITLKNGSTWVQRNLFFTAHIGYKIGLVRRDERLTAGERRRIISALVREWMTTGRHRLVKYDLGVDGLVRRLKPTAKQI